MNPQETKTEQKKASSWMKSAVLAGVISLLGIIVGGYFFSHPY